MKISSLGSIVALFVVDAHASDSAAILSQTARITFSSTTSLASFDAKNDSVVAALTPSTGELSFSVPMQSFAFEKARMQEHFNQVEYLDTKTHPRATFRGRITNLQDISFLRDGRYPATVTGTLTIKGVTKPVTQKGTITVSGAAISASSEFDLSLVDFGLTFTAKNVVGKIASHVRVVVDADFSPPVSSSTAPAK